MYKEKHAPFIERSAFDVFYFEATQLYQCDTSLYVLPSRWHLCGTYYTQSCRAYHLLDYGGENNSHRPGPWRYISRPCQ